MMTQPVFICACRRRSRPVAATVGRIFLLSCLALPSPSRPFILPEPQPPQPLGANRSPRYNPTVTRRPVSPLEAGQLKFNEGRDVEVINDSEDSRRIVLKSIALCFCGAVSAGFPLLRASAANMPTSMGANLMNTGTAEALVPLLRIQTQVQRALDAIASANEEPTDNLREGISAGLKSGIPTEEKAFKRIFDEFSDPVSYKQKYLNNNAFLVYYTRGFDGVNRPGIEEGEVPVQTLQYGFRNDLWIELNDVLVELDFGGSKKDIEDGLKRAILALDRYLGLVDNNVLGEAKKMMVEPH